VISGCGHFITLENGMESGGVGEQIMARISHDLCGKNLFLGAFPDRFITHGTSAQLFREYGLDAESLARRIEKAINER
jgi:1-deoxy-D-xylulose-5-phosphate synthase